MENETKSISPRLRETCEYVINANLNLFEALALAHFIMSGVVEANKALLYDVPPRVQKMESED